LTWNQILSKAEALEMAELTPARDDKRDREEGEIPPAKPPPKEKTMPSFYCKMHDPDQRHNTSNCKVVNGKIERLKGQKNPFNKNSNQQDTKPSWVKNKKCPATSYSTEQLKEVVCMTRKKAMEDAKAQYQTQTQEELHAIQVNKNAAQELEKLCTMLELFINDLIDGESNMEEEEDDLAQAKLDELTASLSA
jgi:DNA-binding Xre family transcriptional regulator